MAINFQILGPLRVTDGDGREIALGGAKPAAVLAMLLLRPNELVAADRLIEDLWEGEPPPTAAKTLQVHISRLRRAIGEAQINPNDSIQTTRGGYLLQVEPEQVDALRFQQLVTEGTASLAEGAHAPASARLRSALALWRGEALADFAYASFAQEDIARLDGLRTVALESAVEADLALGRHAGLIPELKTLVKRHPLSEHLRGQLMLALYRSGRQAEALGVYRAGRRILVEQLGIEPSAELRALEHAILAQDEQLAARSPHVVPRRERAERSSRGPLVGYERELGALEDLLEQALLHQGRLALIAGEPGIGKTRLVDELSTVAHARGAQVVWGRCWSGVGAPAYWPWIQVLRALLADREGMTLRADLGTSAAELIQLLPELRETLPDLAAPEHAGPEEARFSLFEAICAFVTRAAAARPIVIVLDDLHAADASTLALLQFMAGVLLDAPVMVVATYRDTDEALERGLSDALGELARATDCLQLVLTGLSGEDTAHFVELSAGVSPMPTLAAEIHAASSGNPLFVTELVRLLRAEDRLKELAPGDDLGLPRGVDQVIGRRIEHLSEGCRTTLTLAAVVGREFDVTLLERAGDTTGEELLDHVDDAAAARVIEQVPGSTAAFRFSHDLVRQTLHGRLRAVQRRRLHLAVATALEELQQARPVAVVARLAYHFAEALPGGDPGQAVRYLEVAGDNAADLSAYQEAASYYTRAAEIAGANGIDPAQACELYVKLAEQLVVIRDLRRATLAIQNAEALAAAHPEPSRDGRLEIARTYLSLLNVGPHELRRIEEAIVLFQRLDDPLGEARAWGALAAAHCGNSAKFQEGDAAQRMLECARRGGSKALANEAIRAMGSSLAGGMTPVSAAIPRARALLAEARDPIPRASTMVCLAMLSAARGRFDEGRELFAGIRAQLSPTDWLSYEYNLLSYSARLELLAGNMQRAEELARALCAFYRAEGLRAYLSSEQMFLVDALIGQGRLDEAAAELEQAPAAASDDVDALFRQARSRAALGLARGNLETAEEHARTAVGQVAAVESADEHAQTLLVLARVLLAAGRYEEAREVLAEALRIAEERENVVLAQRAREMLAAASPVATAVGT